jgi:hypothetical protein
MGGDQGPVDVYQHLASGCGPVAGRAAAGLRGGPPQRARAAGFGGQSVDEPADRGVGGDRPEHLPAAAQHRGVRRAVPAGREHHRQVQYHLARIVLRARPAEPGQLHR